MPCFSWSVPQLVPLCGGCYVTVLFMRYGVIKVSQFNDICLYVWRWSSEGWFDEFFNWLCPSECLLYKILSKIWRRIQFRTERCGDLVLQVFLCISVQMNKLIVSLSLSLSLARSAWSVAPAVACQYCHNTLCCIPASSGLFRHTHTLTSSMSKLLACAYVCVHMCMRVWVCVCLCVLVPIALASCCSSSFRSSTEEMGEFLTRLTSDGGSGSPCGNHNKRTHLDLIYYITGVILLNNLSSWFPAHKHQHGDSQAELKWSISRRARANVSSSSHKRKKIDFFPPVFLAGLEVHQFFTTRRTHLLKRERVTERHV